LAGRFTVGDWTIAPELNSLERDGQTVRVEPKIMQVLVTLAANPGEVVSKEQILRRVWPGTFVTDEVLTRSVSELRKVFDDNPREPTYIRTIPKGGYQLVALVGDRGTGRDGALPQRWWQPKRWLLVTAAAIVLLGAVASFYFLTYKQDIASKSQITSLAVLPLTNLSGDAGQDYFVDGMTDELITNLAKIESLRVISRTSVMQYKGAHKPLPEIARALNVNLIVEGTVLRSGDRVRITTQLIDGKSDVHLWAQDFHRELRDVIGLQSDIAQAIASEIRVEMTREDLARLAAGRRVDPDAHDAYLRARYQWNKRTGRDLNDSIALYQQAIAADPKYALAYAGMADSYIVLENDGKVSAVEANPIIRSAAMKAVEADPNLADAHMVLGQVRETEWDWAGAEREYRRAIELSPGLARAHHWYAILLIELHRPSEGIAEIERAVDLEPLTENLYLSQSRIYYLARQYDRALRPLRMLKELGKESAAVHELSGFVYWGKQIYPEAISEFQISSSAEPGEPEEWALLTYAYARGGRRKEALGTLAKLNQLSDNRFVQPCWMSVAWMGLGDKDKALYFLNEAYRIRSSGLPSLIADPVFDPLRDDPRFAEVLHRLGLPSS
jgi:TolB-like protein/DNA-binding winged helix-turn-helix (wHTH) protein